MQLFKQDNFAAGLDAEFNPLRTTQGGYPLLINGRNRSGTITPVRKHLPVTGLPSGVIQNIDIVGDLLLAVVAGHVYYKNLASDSAWNSVSESALCDSSVTEVYGQLLSVTSNFFNRSVTDANNVTDVFNVNIASTPQALMLSDGINVPVLISSTGVTISAGTYASWSKNNPKYIPIGILPVVSGQKLFMVSPDRKAIYQSVSGRMTDFMINLDSDGNAGGPASTMQIAVDFNDITNMISTEQQGLVVSTLYGTYLVTPDTNHVFFGEYSYTSELLFPVGAVNHKSTVNLVGDIAFITQSGIQSFNTTSQTKRESNNFPMGAKIQRYLANPQSDTAAINFDDYALFAMNTVFGRAVIVYDTIRQQFVSIDTGFGTVKKFVVYRANGSVRLFFSNTDDQLFEAYADTAYAITGVRLGDFNLNDAAQMHSVDKVYLAFSNIQGTVPVEFSVYADNYLVQRVTSEVSSTSLVPSAPTIVPFVSSVETAVLDCGLSTKRLSFKSSLFISWQGQAELANILLEGAAQQAQMPSVTTPAYTTVKDILILLSQFDAFTVTTESNFAQVDNLMQGDWYVVTGAMHNGGQILYDGTYTVPGTTVYLNGTLANVEDFCALREAVITQWPTGLLTAGDVIQPGGTETDYTRFGLLMAPINLDVQGVAGETEKQVMQGRAWYNRHERYYYYDYEHVRVFFMDSTNGTFDDVQINWLKAKLPLSTKTFNIVVFNDPPYTDVENLSPGNADLRLDFATYGADLVISARARAYERFYIDAFPYIVCGCAGTTFDSFVSGENNSVTRDNTTTGFLRISATQFELELSFIDVEGTVLDATTIYPR